jgi:hypothetical protein
MPPLVFQLLRRKFDTGVPSHEFSEQWTNPGDVFSVLLILGGDVIGRALAQLAGSPVTPVAFSFGTLPSGREARDALPRGANVRANCIVFPL